MVIHDVVLSESLYLYDYAHLLAGLGGIAMLILPLLGFMLLLRGGRDGRLKILLLGLLGLQPRLTVVTGLGGGVAWRRNGPNMKN